MTEEKELDWVDNLNGAGPTQHITRVRFEFLTLMWSMVITPDMRKLWDEAAEVEGLTNAFDESVALSGLSYFIRRGMVCLGVDEQVGTIPPRFSLQVFCYIAELAITNSEGEPDDLPGM